MGLTITLGIVLFTVLTTLGLLLLALALPDPLERHDRDDDRFREEDGHPRVRLVSRLLFTRRRTDSIVLDLLLISVEQAGPGVTAPEGLPFTLQLRTPDTVWFADRVDELLAAWAEDSRELLLELREDHGKVRIRFASGDASVLLELSGAAGLSLTA